MVVVLAGFFFVGSSSGGKKQQRLRFLLGCDGGSTDFFFLFWFWIDCDDASNRSVFALIPKLTQDNQKITETTIK